MQNRKAACTAAVILLATICLGCQRETPKPEANAKEQTQDAREPAAVNSIAAKPTKSEPTAHAASQAKQPAAKPKPPVAAGVSPSVAAAAGSSGGANSTVAQAKLPAPELQPTSPSAGKEKVAAKPAENQSAPLPPSPIERPRPAAAPPALPHGVPKVEMADKDARTCLVRVGDVLPNAELPDLAGKQQRLHRLYGPRLTVVFFWNAAGPYGIEELQDMANGLCAPFDGKGLRVIGVNCRDSAAAARENATAVPVKFPILLDAHGSLLAMVALAGLPRTYLLDASGKILWFDMEYSRSTRNDLIQAIEAAP